MNVRIGNVELSSRLLLSPIAGYCDLPFRLVVRPLGGLGMAYTDLVNPRGLMNRTVRSMQIVQTCAADQPLGIQLYGTDAGELAEASQWAAENGACVVDLNMGCPAKKVHRKGGGCGLLRHPDHAVAIARRVAEACPRPVTVKTRLGWEMGNLVAPLLAKRFEDAGIAALTIHGRYGEQRFKGYASLKGIRSVVQAVEIPVFGNGDVQSPLDAKRMIDQTGCAGVMIGRRALADAWIFRDTCSYLTSGQIPEPPTRLQRTRRMIRHFRNMIAQLGEQMAVVQFRKRMSWYVKTIGPCPELRREIPKAQSLDDWKRLVGGFLNNLRACEQEGRGDAELDILDEPAAELTGKWSTSPESTPGTVTAA